MSEPEIISGASVISPEERSSLEETSKVNKTGKSFLGLGLALVLATSAFFSGLHLGSSQTDTGTSHQANIFSSLFGGPSTEPDDNANLTDFWRVWNLLEEKFVAASSTVELTEKQRVEGAIEGLVDSYGDPYTIFLPPVEAEAFAEDISGNFSGVGMEIGMREGYITVIAPLPDTPAEKAGIVAGDTVVKIDGGSTDGMNVDEAVKLIRGEKGTEVVLTVYREGEVEFIEIPIIRDTINIPTIATDIDGDVFIVTLYSFNAISELKMQEALREFVKSGKQQLILDLRGNPGGYLQSAVAIASYFLPAGKIVVREDFGDGEEEQLYRSYGKTLREYAPKDMVVLIDGGSASASEILAGALSQHGFATLIGDTTFGKGSVQELVELPDGSSIKVTVARWLTPDGTSISNGGLPANINVKRTPQQRIAGEDPQLEAALMFMRGEGDKVEIEARFASSTASLVE